MRNNRKFFHSIYFKMALVFSLMMLITLEVVGAVFVKQLESQNLETFKNSVQVKPYVVTSIRKQLENKNQDEANRQIKSILENIDTDSSNEIQVVDAKGNIRGTNQNSYQYLVGQKTQNTNIKYALNRLEAFEQNTSNGDNRYYTKISPIYNSRKNNNTSLGVVYIKANLNSVYQNINSVTVIYLFASLIAILAILLLTLLISRAITKPIDAMRRQTLKISQGDYSGHVDIYGNDELDQLANEINNLSFRIEESQEASESERRRLDSVLDNMTDGVVSTDRRGKVIIINDEALNFLDIDKDKVIGQSILDVLGLEDRFTFKELMEKPERVFVDYSNEERKLIVTAHFSLIQRESGFVNGLACVLHDVTAQQKLDEDRKQFVSNVSHELRTPLTSVHSYIEALSDGAMEDPELAPKFLNVAKDETDRMTRMINDLLTLSRMDSGTQKFETELVNINRLYNYILDRFDMIIQSDDDKVEKNYSIKRIFSKEDLWVEIDTDRFTQVIDNIMNNAIKYSPDGGVITCRLYVNHNRVILSISDQGLGMPKSAINQIFNRFYRVDKARSRAQGGSGLGLAISKEVIEALNGRIWANSVEGQGSTFYISLPYESVEEDLWDAKED
ncbi:cell wall metabolism sensor histidine kinase WalK [Lactobacillus sp. S2-2]|uniref:cell wall metabolism sensor histidine kinase WalK n=1 Tax=Lactobacillus sp. S2-2 TaxID=2692917 RepID=UPI001F017588|nr:cell wall metabolism sensor histidine kinase WalK [Lactobacillus sp. S2-2]MCF6515582.1 cell wall metabolism sensor histidine kinase WalK [Lactobacillus sp. S2-2]